MRVILNANEAIRMQLSSIEGSNCTNASEYVLIEMQGTIISRDGESFDDLVIGNLTYELVTSGSFLHLSHL